MKEIDVLAPFRPDPGSYSVAMVLDGDVWGVLLVGPDNEVQRAWIDEALPEQTMYEKMVFRSDDPHAVLTAIRGVLNMKEFPERNVKEFCFDLALTQACVTRLPDD